jgi:hypothetical protein
MALATGTITELHLETAGETRLVGAHITCPPSLRPAPGQYLSACSSSLAEPLPVALFPAGLEGDELVVAPPLPAHWTAGTQLSLRGPLGRGFRLPVSARRVALAGLDVSPSRLLPLAFQALAQHASVALYSRFIPHGLPPEVEVLQPDLLPEASAWADYLAIDAPLIEMANLRQAMGLGLYARPACQVQVLLLAHMPCGGMAECGVCAVPTRDGWRLACSDGPVFDWNNLEV